MNSQFLIVFLSIECFGNNEEYYEYVEKRKALGFEVDDDEVDDEGYVEELWDDTEPEEEEEEPVQLMSAKESTSKAAAIPAKKSKVETKFVNAGTKGIQSFFKFGKTMYVIQHFSDGVKVTKCAKRKISKASLKSINSDTAAIWNIKENDTVYDLKGKGTERMTLKNFHHGQTLEMFTMEDNGVKTTYLMVTAGKVVADKKKNIVWGNAVGFIRFIKGTYDYKDEIHLKKLSPMFLTSPQNANKKGKSARGTLHVEACLSTDKKTILLWTQLAKKGKEKGQIQLTCINKKKLMSVLKKQNNKGKEKLVKLNCKNIPKKSIICTATQTKAKGNWGKPYDSLQSIDMTNPNGSGNYTVYVAGGSEGNRTKKGKAAMPCALMRYTITKKGTSEIKKKKRIKTNIKALTVMNEMEGMHYDGDIHYIMTTVPECGNKKNTVTYTKKTVETKDDKTVTKKEKRTVKLSKQVQVMFMTDKSNMD